MLFREATMRSCHCKVTHFESSNRSLEIFSTAWPRRGGGPHPTRHPSECTPETNDLSSGSHELFQKRILCFDLAVFWRRVLAGQAVTDLGPWFDAGPPAHRAALTLRTITRGKSPFPPRPPRLSPLPKRGPFKSFRPPTSNPIR